MSNFSGHREGWTAKARLLLAPALADDEGGVWADLGCGDGIFTFLLCAMLTPGSQIYAVDRDRLALERVAQRKGTLSLACELTTLHGDFTRPRSLHLPPLDGILLANSLHFVADKPPVVATLAALLKEGGKLVVVEYNTRQGTSAVPFPIHESDFEGLAEAAGLEQARVVTRAPSTFLGEMFTGVAVKVGG
ncbi:MAG: class I SAM-dependent methyltransferase [Chloroflexi bacterium]|nr:MAG: class I SAM-dependent methyltransferase [Chloroflexota bacterium]